MPSLSLRLSCALLVALCAPVAGAQGLDSAGDAFPAGRPMSGAGLPLGMPGSFSAQGASPLGVPSAAPLGLPGSAGDFAGALHGAPLGAAQGLLGRLQRLLGFPVRGAPSAAGFGGMPGAAGLPGGNVPVGAVPNGVQGTPFPGQSTANVVTMPGFTPAQDANSRVDGVGNLIRATPGATPLTP